MQEDTKKIITLDTFNVALEEIDKRYATKEELSEAPGMGDVVYATDEEVKALFEALGKEE